jgi:hypothetical protein
MENCAMPKAPVWTKYNARLLPCCPDRIQMLLHGRKEWDNRLKVTEAQLSK